MLNNYFITIFNFYIREPIKKPHGMPANKIRALFTDCRLMKKDYIISARNIRAFLLPDLELK